MIWAGYALFVKPTVLSMADWRTALLALRDALNARADDPMPSRRLHWRASLDDTEYIVEAAFEADNLTLDKIAQYIANALSGKYTVAQVKTAITNKVTLWGLGGRRADSGDSARAYIAANAAKWEVGE